MKHNELEKRYGLMTAIGMVVGIVIGSGVFFKAEAVLKATGGNMPLGIVAWLAVGMIMIACAYCFATLANRYENASGLVDYAEEAVGGRYAYFVGWFMAAILGPTLTSVLAWVSARYICVLLGWDITGGACMTMSAFLLCMAFVINSLAPRIAGKFQVSATVIKMIPLALMAIVGTIAGLGNGMLAQNFSTASTASVSASTGLMSSIVAVAFAYEGWIFATSIHGELKNAERNLPLALILGSLVVVATYILYYIGLSGAVTTAELMESGQAAAKMAFQRMFGETAGALVFVLIVISCLGTLNGLMLGCCRGFYAVAIRGRGPNPKLFSKIDPVSNMPVNSAIMGLAINAFWLLYFYGANLDTVNGLWFGAFCFDSSELPIVTLYAMYIPLFVQLMRHGKGLNVMKRIIMPILAIVGCLIMLYAAFVAHGAALPYYLIIFAVIMAIGAIFYRKQTTDM